MATATVYFLDGPEARTTREMVVNGGEILQAKAPPISAAMWRPPGSTPEQMVCKVFTYRLMRIPDMFPNAYPAYRDRYIAMLKEG